MKQQPSQYEASKPRIDIDTTRNVLAFAALTVMVILRRDVGYRMVKPGYLIGVNGFLFVLMLFVDAYHPDKPTNPLLYFAVVSFALGMYQRIKGWWQFNRGVRQHSFYLGTSPFEFRWLPMFFQKNRRVARFIDPIFCVLTGLLIFPWFHALGFWVMGAGASLRVFEGEVYERQRERTLNIVDGLIAADIQGQVVEQFEDAPNIRRRQPESGVPTGLGDDIQEHIKRRRAKPPPPQKGA